MCSKQGCGVGVEAGVGVDRSRPFLPESESELESVTFYRLRPGVAAYHPSTDDDIDGTVMNHLGNIERQEERDSGSVQIMPKRHLVIESRLIKVSELTIRVKRGHPAGGDTSAAPRPAGKLGAGPKANHEIDATKINSHRPKNVAAL